MRNFLINLMIIIIAVFVLVLTSALLEFEYFVKYIERRVLVVLIQLIELVTFFRIVVEFNKSNTNHE